MPIKLLALDIDGTLLTTRGELTARLIGVALILLGLLVVIQPQLMTTLPG